ncbi:hypothetical protein PR202_gb24893 [Eleusine coracana subsp. coracana]|uniref:PDZ domain-containing protein n=1 Tax=Eleusine coracana subsp. coracana TaxID=191504 RepID=A0AAV5FMN6_ELECO|nr:hypothetical protein PR202_gb24893 [Eleusine coracana subsp. coracana]
MAPATTQEEGGEASRSRWWRVQRGHRIRCAPNTTPEEAEEASRSPSVAGSRSPRGGGLTHHAPNPTHEGSWRSQCPVDEPSSRQGKKRKRDANKSKKRKRARDTEQAHYSGTSSATSSPLRWPIDPPPSQVFDPAIEDACVKLRSKFRKKSDDKPLSQSSGFLIDWNKDSKPNTILTSALLIRSNSPSGEWSGTEEYIPDAMVLVHLLDKHETTIAAHLLHYDKHFNIALFKIDTDVSAEILSFSTEWVSGGSVAEKLGVRTGDIIESLNGESIATTIELENMLMSVCEDYSDNGDGIGSIVNITSIHESSKLVAEMLSNFTLSLATLMVVDLANPVEMTPERISHFQMLFETLLEKNDVQVWDVSTRIAGLPELEILRDGIVLFIKQHVIAKDTGKDLASKFKIAMKALDNTAGVLMQVAWQFKSVPSVSIGTLCIFLVLVFACSFRETEGKPFPYVSSMLARELICD